LMVWWVAYAGVYQLRILDEREEIHALMLGRSTKLEPVLITEPKTTDNGYTVQLKRLMEEEHLYRNPDLGRQMVAEHLGISEGYVSQVMQENVGEGFVEFVNGHRIMAAKRMLSDPDFAPYSLEAIGREAGFKSRSSFYDSFKKATGQTPGTYRKRGKNVLI
jgi:AraC-like DNA-binding protein